MKSEVPVAALVTSFAALNSSWALLLQVSVSLLISVRFPSEYLGFLSNGKDRLASRDGYTPPWQFVLRHQR